MFAEGRQADRKVEQARCVVDTASARRNHTGL